jgi:hypothetical protein
MDTLLVWIAIAFIAGAVFGMTMSASVFSNHPRQQPTVVVMEQRRPELLQETGGGCLTYIFLVIMLIGAVAALMVLSS